MNLEPMKNLLKLAGPLLLGAALIAGCDRKVPPPPAANPARSAGLTPAPAPWEPVDKQFTGCAGS